MKYLIAILFFLTYTLSFADHHKNDRTLNEQPIITQLPSNYSEFVGIIGILTIDEIINILGEPAKKIELKVQSSNDVIARTWYYHNINTDESGKYFPTTELDIVDGYVESVVFMNEINETTEIEAKKYNVKPNRDF